MRALIQRVSHAKVEVEGVKVGSIQAGILTLLGIGQTDTEVELRWLIEKIVKLRIFEDEAGKMNRSLLDVRGSHLIISQFTLYGDASKGNRPSFIQAATPVQAQPLYERAIELSRSLGVNTECGRFGADMKVTLLNDGPVTLLIDS